VVCGAASAITGAAAIAAAAATEKTRMMPSAQPTQTVPDLIEVAGTWLKHTGALRIPNV
jgi:hypothetical protein